LRLKLGGSLNQPSRDLRIGAARGERIPSPVIHNVHNPPTRNNMEAQRSAR
jgi:CspA family cold shock protein